ncbi:T9SS type A sorting domain-containing protein [Flavobacterium salilacus subsp. salilacus]|uniref:alpha-amylase family glycosyl hydrolase n=1 Tax=Flavobacterium TaxID=237 RepID=UPI00107580B2|nr:MULTISPECIES: alpha-amylase family glycosyl hydrolase [Flavobacterium]KAF2514831.1 T9SS type A sorting domain-containing protein [Flavobacterium salilacus subsp. salilacus]MBE1615445.1 T9SS type A sorting domain-containing protein [Flavobacterium sp. SaA2.13]
MKKFTILFLLLSFAGFAQVTTTPTPAIATAPVTLNFNKAGTGLAGYNGTVYAHIGLTVDGTQWQYVIGNWGANTVQPALTNISGNNYTLQLSPDLYTYFGVPTTSTITQICVVFRSAAEPYQQTQDYFINVGSFQVNLTAPQDGSTTLLSSGGSLNITATNTGGNANYTLMSNGATVNSSNGVSSYSFNHTNITSNQNYELVVTQGGNTITKNFSAVVNPNTVTQAMPAGVRDGINYNNADATKATLVLNAPYKDYVYVAGSFNNWQPTSAYAMKKDGATGKYWLEITGLTPGEINTFQYWVVDETPFTNSPAMVKTADPFSTLVLSPYDDPYIDAATYPNLPAYPAGQSFEVSVLQTAQPAYNWQVTNFEKPEKEDLIIYELVIRDFNQQKTWESLTNQLEYLRDLNINAIEIMPVMEFEGNISWGYNTAYHLALDKAYGTQESMKQFIDACHQNGIAVILDVALNHVYGRSPLARMWVDDPDGDGFGNTTTENPYCNVVPTHSYSVGTDLNHQSELTQYYTERTIEYWMTEFKIDGFRWDLTKGFTQNCTANDQNCTNAYQADRVAILKQYADYQWAIDPDFYVIFEHLGGITEEKEWADYRIDEGKGIMLWGKFTDAYNQNSMGYAENSNFNSMDFENKTFQQPRLVGYAESHDEERLMFKNLAYGNSSGNYDVTEMATALDRMKAVGAILFTIPGPKMLWQFGELGYEYSINYCEDGTINDGCRTNPKPIPFELGYTGDADRMGVYNTWADIIKLRLSNPVFHTNTFTIDSGDLTPRIDIWNDDLADGELSSIIVLANFNVTAQTVDTFFPTTDDWYDLLNLDAPISGTVASITLQPGEFKIFGNQEAFLHSENVTAQTVAALYPNPATSSFSINIPTEKVEVYALTGQLIKKFSGAPANTSFDIETLNDGIYFVKITDDANRVSTIKMIKK